MNEDIDLTGVDPLRWAEIRKRAQVVQEYAKIGNPARDQLRDAAAALGLSTCQFSRLVSVWRTYGQASLLSTSGANKGQKRANRDGLPTETRRILEEVIEEMGLEAGTTAIHKAAAPRCQAAGCAIASTDTVWAMIMEARKQRNSASNGPNGILIARASFALPVITARGLVRPHALIALLLPEGTIVAKSVAFGEDDRIDVAAFIRSLASAADQEGQPKPLILNRLDRSISTRDLAGLQVETVGSTQALLSRSIGNMIGDLRLVLRPSAARDAKHYMRTAKDAALSPSDAVAAIEHAIDIHNKARSPGRRPTFGLSPR